LPVRTAVSEQLVPQRLNAQGQLPVLAIGRRGFLIA
jgi:hypothetical protein